MGHRSQKKNPVVTLPVAQPLERRLQLAITPVTFTGPQNFPVLSNPIGIAAGDFNSDGLPDIVTADSTGTIKNVGNTVSVLFGNANGGFHFVNKTDMLVGSDPQGIAVGDLVDNLNIHTTMPTLGLDDDIVVANANSNDISVILGNGNGTFPAAVPYFVGQLPQTVALGDFNGDGYLDIVVANELDGTVTVLLNNGANAPGTFPIPLIVQGFHNPNGIILPVGTDPIGVAIGDINGDGKNDIVVTNSHDADIEILLGNGDGSFKPGFTVGVGNKPLSATLADVNGDGHLDVLVANYNDNTISVLLGNGDGTFLPQEVIPVGTRPAQIVLGDFNGDGIPDLLVANYGSNNVSALVGNGDGSFEPAQNQATGNGPFGIVYLGNTTGDTLAADILFNEDAFVTSNFNGNDVSLCFNTTPPVVYLTGGILHVIGTSGSDTLSLTVDHGQITATRDFEDKFFLGGFFNQNYGPFLLTAVNSFDVEGLDGNDSIVIGTRIPGGLANGGTGNDTIVALNDVTDTLVGGPGADSLTADNLAGDDLMNGGQGADTIVCGTGNTTVHGGKGTDSIVGGSGNDELVGGGGADTILGSIQVQDTGSSFLSGGPGSDSIVGGPDDTIVGGVGGLDSIQIVGT